MRSQEDRPTEMDHRTACQLLILCHFRQFALECERVYQQDPRATWIPLLSCSRVIWCFGPVSSAVLFERLSPPCLASSQQFCVAVQRASERLSASVVMPKRAGGRDLFFSDFFYPLVALFNICYHRCSVFLSFSPFHPRVNRPVLRGAARISGPRPERLQVCLMRWTWDVAQEQRMMMAQTRQFSNFPQVVSRAPSLLLENFGIVVSKGSLRHCGVPGATFPCGTGWKGASGAGTTGSAGGLSFLRKFICISESIR